MVIIVFQMSLDWLSNTSWDSHQELRGRYSMNDAISDSMRYVATRDRTLVFGGKWFSLAVKSGIYRQGEDDADII